MSTPYAELTMRVDELARDLAEARRQIDRLRMQRAMSAPGVAALLILSALSTEWVLSLRAAETQPAQVRAPFEVVDATGKAIFRVIESGAPTGGGVVITGGDAQGARHGLYVLNKTGARIVALGQMDNDHGSLLVRNAEGQPVFTVSDGAPKGSGVVVTGGEGGARQGVYVLNQTGSSVVSIGQAAGGEGAILIRDQSARTRIRLDGTGTLSMDDAAGKSMFHVSDKLSAAARVSIGTASDSGNYVVSVSSASGTQVAALGGAKAGGGVVVTYNEGGQIGAIVSGTGQIHTADATGTTRAVMAADNGQGSFSIRNRAGTTVARLGEGTGGGLLQIADGGGHAMVEAGIHPSGIGLVRAFPLGSPGAGLVGMPGTFLLGRPGGQ